MAKNVSTNRILQLMDQYNLFDQGYETVVAKLFGQIKGVSRNKIRECIDTLIADGTLAKKKLNKIDSLVKVENTKEYSQVGTFFYNNKHEGGYIIYPGSETQIRVSPAECKSYPNGIVVQFTTDSNGQASILRVINNNGLTLSGVPVNTKKIITGTIMVDDNNNVQFYAKTAHGYDKTPYEVLITDNVKKYIGKIVNVHVVDFEARQCLIEHVYNDLGDLQSELDAIADSTGLHRNITPQEQYQLDLQPTTVDKNTINIVNENIQLTGNPYDPAKPTYVDLSDKFWITMDPPDSKDFDDAVCVEVTPSGRFVLYVGIADVAKYITEDSPLWTKAMQQMFTLYQPGRAIDMLTHKPASGICSLNPKEDRLSVGVKFEIDPVSGEIIDGTQEPFQAIIHSKERTNYYQAQNILDTMGQEEVVKTINLLTLFANAKNKPMGAHDLNEAIALFGYMTNKMKQATKRRGSLRLESNEEVNIHLTENQNDVTDISKKEIVDTMSSIEVAMVAANRVIAQMFYDWGINCIYRVHGEPSDMKIDILQAVTDALDINFNGDGSNKGLQKLLLEVEGLPIEDAMKNIVKRSLDRAKYSIINHPSDNKGNILEDQICHTALALEYYIHFTSPIRRGPDLINHKLLKQVINNAYDLMINGTEKEEAWSKAVTESRRNPIFTKEYLKEMAAHATSQEKIIDDADRKSVDCCMARYALHHINDTIEGSVFTINDNYVTILTDKGMKVDLPLSDFAKKNYSIEKNHTVIYDRNGKVLVMLGQIVKCKISDVDIINSKIYGRTDFTLTYDNIFKYTEKNITQSFSNALLLDNFMVDASLKEDRTDFDTMLATFLAQNPSSSKGKTRKTSQNKGKTKNQMGD